MATTITTHAYARAGLVGNPSDGYFGKTISFIIRNHRATVTLSESDRFEVVPGEDDLMVFESVNDFLANQKLYGYYGGMRLILAAVKKFHDHFAAKGIQLPNKKFRIAYESDVPRLVGMAGSSAIITATLRALLQFYQVSIDKPLLPSVILSVENDELGIAAGLQDRVIQVYEGITCMDFDKPLLDTRGYGEYEELRPPAPPPLYVAYDPDRAKISGVPHSTLRKRWTDGDPIVHQTMKDFRGLVDRARIALLAGDWPALSSCIDENFELRRKIMALSSEYTRMVDVARRAGASAHFSGSGGAIAGLCEERDYANLCSELNAIGCTVFRPTIDA